MLFQSTCPARGTTAARPAAEPMFRISIHVPREGHDDVFVDVRRVPPNFNPRAPRGARQSLFLVYKPFSAISIHVPREGHDLRSAAHRAAYPRISIHVPREGHDTVLVALVVLAV